LPLRLLAIVSSAEDVFVFAGRGRSSIAEGHYNPDQRYGVLQTGQGCQRRAGKRKHDPDILVTVCSLGRQKTRAQWVGFSRFAGNVSARVPSPWGKRLRHPARSSNANWSTGSSRPPSELRGLVPGRRVDLRDAR
jgi:hypothetical protein